MCLLTWRTTLLVNLSHTFSVCDCWTLQFCSNHYAVWSLPPSGWLITVAGSNTEGFLSSYLWQPSRFAAHSWLLLVKTGVRWQIVHLVFRVLLLLPFPLVWPGSRPRGTSGRPHSEHRCWWSYRASVADLVRPRRTSSSWHHALWVLWEVITSCSWTGSRVPCVLCGSSVSPSMMFLPTWFGLSVCLRFYNAHILADLLLYYLLFFDEFNGFINPWRFWWT